MTDAVLKLQDAGFERAQVEALTNLVAGKAATKEDIANLRGDIKEDNANLRGDIKEDIANLRGDIKEDVARLEGDITRLEGKVETKAAKLSGDISKLYWMFGVLIVINTGVGLKIFFG